jgi:hypothetical protein
MIVGLIALISASVIPLALAIALSVSPGLTVTLVGATYGKSAAVVGIPAAFAASIAAFAPAILVCSSTTD